MFDVEAWMYRTFNDVEVTPKDFRVDCPFCGDDISKHLYISATKEVAHCFRCGWGGGWVKLVMEVDHCSYTQALGELYAIPRMRDFQHKLDKLSATSMPTPVRCHLPDDFIPLYDMDPTYANPYIKYLRGRGFNMEQCQHYNLGTSRLHPARVIIPVEGEYWQGRSIYLWLGPKYINPKLPSSTYIFNSQAMQLYDEVVVCEGCFSAMAVGHNAIALLGKEAPEQKLQRLLGSDVKHFIFAIEPEAGGLMAVADGIYRHGYAVTLWKYIQGDPADPRGDFTIETYGYKAKVEAALDKMSHSSI